MIKNIKDLSKVALNAQDVMVMATVKLKKTVLDLSTVENKKDLEGREQLLKLEIIAVGSEVLFKPKDLIEVKDNARINFDILEEVDLGKGWIQEFRVGVFHMNNIEYAISPDNYKE
jgi:hypothetical protein